MFARPLERFRLCDDVSGIFCSCSVVGVAAVAANTVVVAVAESISISRARGSVRCAPTGSRQVTKGWFGNVRGTCDTSVAAERDAFFICGNLLLVAVLLQTWKLQQTPTRSHDDDYELD